MPRRFVVSEQPRPNTRVRPHRSAAGPPLIPNAMPFLYILLLGVLLTACDSGAPGPVVPPPDPAVGRGTFTALLNGEPWTAPVTYRHNAVYGSLTLSVSRLDSASYYEQLLIFGYWGTGLVEGQVAPLGGVDAATGLENLVFLNEKDGDSVFQTFRYVPSEPGALRVVEVDSSADRLRATFEGTFARDGGVNAPYTRLPDTLRFTEGVLVTGLFPPAD